MRYQEPGLNINDAWEINLDQNTQDYFYDLFHYLNQHQATQGVPITIPPGALPFDSAYDLPGNSQRQGLVGEYIRDNHPFTNAIYELIAGPFSVIDLTGLNFSSLLTIKVNFPDGSSGVFQLVTIGVSFQEWEIIESTFYDADGNQILFGSDEYDGTSGGGGGSTIPHLIDYLSQSGWIILYHGPRPDSQDNLECSWRCDSSFGDDPPKCTVSCAPPSG